MAPQDKNTPPPLPEPLRVAVADSHTHLDMQDSSVEEALAKAASVGVTTVVQVGCDLAGSRWAAETAAAHASVHATVALHPNEAPRIVLGDPDGWSRQGAREPGGDSAPDAALAEIDRLAALPQVRGVGETGLDYFRTGPEGMAAQEASFRAHIEIAKRHDKALVIHDREAHDDVLRILREEGAPDRVVFHCYSGDAGMAKVCAAAATSCPSPATSPSKTPSTCATPSPSPRPSWSSSRPTPPSSHPPRTADGPTPRTSFRSRCGPWPR